jgi:proton-coupled amino acid transporter
MAPGAEAAAPLLAREEGSPRRGGGATSVQTLGNVVVSIVGTGVLGLPYAFSAAGWLAGSVGVATAGFATLYCMLLLVSTPAYLSPPLTLPANLEYTVVYTVENTECSVLHSFPSSLLLFEARSSSCRKQW